MRAYVCAAVVAHVDVPQQCGERVGGLLLQRLDDGDATGGVQVVEVRATGLGEGRGVRENLAQRDRKCRIGRRLAGQEAGDTERARRRNLTVRARRNDLVEQAAQQAALVLAPGVNVGHVPPPRENQPALQTI